MNTQELTDRICRLLDEKKAEETFTAVSHPIEGAFPGGSEEDEFYTDHRGNGDGFARPD